MPTNPGPTITYVFRLGPVKPPKARNHRAFGFGHHEGCSDPIRGEAVSALTIRLHQVPVRPYLTETVPACPPAPSRILHPTRIRWHLDGNLVHERVNWDPTPVSHLPMQFNVNLWHSRSEELVGRLSEADLPAQCELSLVEIRAEEAGLSGHGFVG